MSSAADFTPTPAYMRTELALIQAQLTILSEHARLDLEEIQVAHALDFAAEKCAAAFAMLEMPMRMAGDERSAWFGERPEPVDV